MTDSQTFGSEYRPVVTPDLDQVRATVQALQGAANLLQGAMEQRQGLWTAVQDAERSLIELRQQRAEAERALNAAHSSLERTAREVEQVRSEQGNVLADFERLVQGALARRAGLVAEIAELERRRDLLAEPSIFRAEPWTEPSYDPAPAPEAIYDFAPSIQPIYDPAPAHLAPADSAPTPFGPAASKFYAAAEPWSPADVGVPVASVAQAPTAPTEALVMAMAEALAPSVALPAPAPTPFVTQSPTPEAASFTERVIALESEPAVVVASEPAFVAYPGVARQAPRLRVEPPAPKRSFRLSFRHLLTGFAATLLLALAVLLTPVTQALGGLQLLAVMSGSMEPTIHVGGVVGIHPVATSDLQVGDVITFASPSAPDLLVTHRIVSLEDSAGQTLITTKGDANDSVDALTSPATRAVGRVDFSLPWLGYLMVWLASPLAKVGIMAVSIAGFALPSFKRSPALPAPAPAASDATYANLEREIDALVPHEA